jgi:predicted RNA-binding protein YlxR (DUF448 family)
MVKKKIPLRMCCGCNEMKTKREMIRVVKSPDGEISLDFTGKKSGRGAYICHNNECLEKAQKAKRLEKALSCAISKEIYEEMANELSKQNT